MVCSVFHAIQTAVAQGFVVVEAAGNGNVNLDQPACDGLFDRTVRDSERSSWVRDNHRVVGLTANAQGFQPSGTALICRGGDRGLRRQDTEIYMEIQMLLPILTFDTQLFF